MCSQGGDQQVTVGAGKGASNSVLGDRIGKELGTELMFLSKYQMDGFLGFYKLLKSIHNNT